MIATQQEKVLWVFDLVGQKQADGLQRLLPSIHVVTQEQVVTLWGEASVFKEPEQIIVLAVDVACGGGAVEDQGYATPAPTVEPNLRLVRVKLTADLQGSFQLQKDGLAQEDFTGLEAEATDLTFCQLHVLPGPGSFHWERKRINTL